MSTSVIDDRALAVLLCTPMTETARAEKLGITRPSYYRLLDRLNRDGILRRRGHLALDMVLRGSHPRSRFSGTHHAPVQHILWTDSTGRWEVQGQLLDKWAGENVNNTTITVRYYNPDFATAAFEVRPLNRWSTTNTSTHLPIGLPWDHLCPLAVEKLTIAIARLIDAEAIIVPENKSVEQHPSNG